MKETLEKLNWEMYYECNTCQGHKQFFTHADKPGYEVRIKARNQTFSILLNNNIIGGPFWGYQMEEKIKQYVS